MKVFLASEFRCNIYKGDLYLLPKAYNIYKRYADAFGKLTLCSRFVQVDELSGGMKKADFIANIINIDSLYKVLLGRYRKSIEQGVSKCDIVILRLPSIIAYETTRYVQKYQKKYLVELMCDGWDPYWNHGLLGKMIAPYMHFRMKSITRDADYALYVTEKFLQERYPCKNPGIHASNVVIHHLSQSVLENRLKRIRDMDKTNFSIMTTADVDVLSKGHRFAIQAIKELKHRGINITYFLAGAGDQSVLKKVARNYGVENNLVFLGRLTVEKVYEYLDSIDIYVHPSLQEGLPRAVIEAMSRACPCLGAHTAGIPELLDSECIFKPASVTSIVDVMMRFIKQDISVYAKRNFEHSKLYLNDILDSRRNQYFKAIVHDIEGKQFGNMSIGK